MKKLILSLLLILSCSSVFSSVDLKKYRQQFEKLESLQSDLMARRRFTLADKQLKRSMTYKVLLKDQNGEEWLFKTGMGSSMDGAVSIYRVGLYLGIDSPEIHYATLNLNGEWLTGSLQRLVPTKSEYISLQNLSPKAHQYMAQQHALSYLMTNHHVHPKQFIFPSDTENFTEILRIDNSINWFLLGHDTLTTDYNSPMATHIADAGYFHFWNDYLAYDIYLKGLEKGIAFTDNAEVAKRSLIRRKLTLDIQSLYSMALFYNQMPEDLFKKILQPNVDNKFMYSSNNFASIAWYSTAEYMLQSHPKDFIPKMLKRKKQAPKEFKKFYEYIEATKEEKIKLKDDISKAFDENMAFLSKKIQNTELKLSQMSVPGESQAQINPDISIKHYVSIVPLLALGGVPTPMERLRIINNVLTSLKKHHNDASTESEKNRMQYAIDNVEKLKTISEKEANRASMVKYIIDYHNIFEKDGLEASQK